MGVRYWLMMMALVIGAALLLAACTSPGSTFAYRDLKVSVGPTSAPAQPATPQTSTISFTLRNTWDQPVTGVKWVLRDTTDVLNVVVVDEDDTVAIAAFERVVIDVALGTLAAGTRTYEVVVDPDNTQAEDDETNNTSSTLTVVTADQDIRFGTPAPVITWPTTPNTTDQATLTFTIDYIANPAATVNNSVQVSYNITIKDTPDGTPVAVVPVSATPGSPATVDPVGTIPVPVSVTLPTLPSAGVKYIYTITLSTSAAEDGDPDNNTATVSVKVPASG